MYLLPLHAGSYELLTYFAPAATAYLGIGIQEGVCVEHVVRAQPSIDLTLCDTWGREHGGTGRGSSDHVVAKLDAHGHVGLRRFLDGYSQQLIPQLPLRDTFNLIYVDGSHEEAAAFDDLQNVWPRLRLGGILLVHDVKMPPVWSACLRWLDTIDTMQSTVGVAVGGHGTLIVEKR